MIQRTQYLQPVARSPLKWTGKKAEQRMREWSLIAKMMFYIQPFMENTDDKNVTIVEWSIENEMVTGPESIQILSDVIV